MSIRLISFLCLLCCTLGAQAGGFLVTQPTNGRAIILQERSQNVDLRIQDQFAVTTTEQVFFNPSRGRLEGYFAFPVPQGAVVKDFKMEINGKLTEGELLDAGKARKIYEDIVRQMKDPALLEYVDQGLFKVRIFPIEPQRETKVRFTYTEALRSDNGQLFYDYVMSSPTRKDQQAGNFVFAANVQSKGELRGVYCPSHELDVVRKSASEVSLSCEINRGDKPHDLRLYITRGGQAVGLDLLSFKEANDDGFFFLQITPAFEAKSKIQPKDITFVLDVSGSMAGEKLTQAQRALQFCVSNLRTEDRFEVIRFSTEAHALFGSLTTANKAAKDQAKGFIDDFRAIGGTNIQAAFQLALANGTASRPHAVVFLTDGKPTIGERSEEALLKQIEPAVANHTRIFTFGIGNEINTHLLDKITERTQAFRSYVTPKEDIEIKVSNFFTKVSSPVMSNLKLHFGPGAIVEQVYPKELPDLFAGGTVTVFGRYRQPGKSPITLSGTVNGVAVKHNYKADLAAAGTPHDFIPGLWASRAVGFLLDEIRLNGETQETRSEVVRIARKYGIITPYTSYLILEDTPLAPRPNPIRPFPLPPPPGGAHMVPTEGNIGLFDQKASESEELKEEVGKAYNWSINEKQGAKSVAASEDIQKLRSNASATYSVKLEDSSMSYLDKDGNTQNLATMNTLVNGRAIYNNGDSWVDPSLHQPQNQNLAKVELKFGSKPYFDFMNSNLDAGPFLALGTNVQFAYNGQWVIVSE